MLKFRNFDETFVLLKEIAQYLRDEIDNTVKAIEAKNEVNYPETFETIEEPVVEEPVEACVDCDSTCSCDWGVPTYETSCTEKYPSYDERSINGWVNIGDDVWVYDVVIPVEKEFVEVNILDGNTVHISYDKRVEINDENSTGYHSSTGSFAFPIVSNADISTFKAKYNDEWGLITLSVKKFSPVVTETCKTIEIEG